MMYETKWIKTTYEDEQELLASILKLYLNGSPVDIDPCFSKGNVWKGLPQPLWKYDLNPQTKYTMRGDARNLVDWNNGVVGSVFFDPPWMIGAGAKSVMGQRYSSFKSLDELWTMVNLSIQEFQRILRDGGVLIVKCQDLIVNHEFVPLHCGIIDHCERIGLNLTDIFILVRGTAMLNNRVETQIHARKTHSYYLVFHKNKPRLD
jgi:hypothetical protein